MFHRAKAEAGSALAQARIAAHGSFDQIWKSGHMSRSRAYRWLAHELGIHPNDCHMVLFDEGTCDRVRRLCDQYLFKKTFDI